MTNEIQQITELLKATSSEALTHYSERVYAEGVMALVAAGILLLIAIVGIIVIAKDKCETDKSFAAGIAIFFGLMFGVLMLRDGVVKVSSPNGVATQQLIRDVR